MGVPQLLQVPVQLLLLLLHSLVVHLVQVLLTQQLLVGPLRFLSHDDRLVQLLTQTADLPLHLLTLLVLPRHSLTPHGGTPTLLQLVPLLLEMVEALPHLVPDEEVTEELVHLLTLALTRLSLMSL